MSSSPAPNWTDPVESHAGEVRKLSTLLEASQALASTPDLKEGLRRVLDILGRHHGAIRSTVVLLNDESGDVELEAWSGDVSPRKRVKYRIGEGITGQVVATGRPMVVPRVSREPEFLHRAADRPELRERELSYVSAPVTLEGKTIGAVGIDLLFKPDRDFDRSAKFLGVVASMIAQAVKVHRLIEADHKRLVDENRHLRQELKERYDFSNLVGTSGPIRQVYEQISQVARTNTTVLLRGESGTGKELIAHALHYNSARMKKPFIKVSCAALPHDLIESELFGYEKGAFTGALTSKKGRFELADGGTLFLDEIGELNLSTQIKLLRVLQEREFERLGGTETIRANIRLIAATNKDLEKAIAAGEFREDLYYRLNVFAIYVPPLRERKPDITLPGRLLRREVLARARQERQAHRHAGHRHAGELSLARQRPRARQRHRAGGRDLRRAGAARASPAADASDGRSLGHRTDDVVRECDGRVRERRAAGRAEERARQPGESREAAGDDRANLQLPRAEIRHRLAALQELIEHRAARRSDHRGAFAAPSTMASVISAAFTADVFSTSVHSSRE